MRKIKKGDTVMVLSGADKKRQGKVLRIFTQENRALVEGIRLVKKHIRANPQRDQPGGIITREALVHLSNLALYNPKTGKADKIGFRQAPDGKARTRYFRSNGEQVDAS